MNPETLLGLISGGRYQTSADLPTVPEMAHSYIDQVKEAHDQQMQRDTQIQGQGLGLLDMVGGFSKAGALIPAFTKKYAKSPSGQSQVDDMIKLMSKERRKRIPGRTKMDTQLRTIPRSRIMLQVFEKALEQYKQFGAARPGTEDFIQTLLRELKK
jgi:hypothetical protein